MLKIEIWKRIIYKGEKTNYDVSTEGRVRNHKNRKILALGKKKNGYYIANIRIHKSKQKNFYIHRLVAVAFIENPDPENFKEVNHIDGDKSNNCDENLEWVSSSYNQKHAFKIGLKKPMSGEKNPNSEHSDDEIRKICEMIESGMTNKEIHKKTGVKKSVINSIRNRRRWVHISNGFNFGKCISEYNSDFSIDDIEKCCQMLQDGYSSKEITEATGINNNIISKIRHGKAWVSISSKYNIKPMHKKTDLTQYWDTIEKMLREGYTRKEIRDLYPIKGITESQYVNLIQSRINYLKNHNILEWGPYRKNNNSTQVN